MDCIVCNEYIRAREYEYVQFVGTRALEGSTYGIMLPVCKRCLNTKFVRNKTRDYNRALELGA